jgi:hypothetical protein
MERSAGRRMSTIRDSREVERLGRELMRPFIEEMSGGRYVRADHGVLAEYIQQLGDVLLQAPRDLLSLEEKAERRHTGNLFMETWSNRTIDLRGYVHYGDKAGWLVTTRALLLAYVFLDKSLLCLGPLPETKRFLLDPVYDDRGQQHPPRIWNFPQREQGECEQLNHTHGHLVPIGYLVKHCHFQCFRIDQQTMFPLDIGTLRQTIESRVRA